MYCPACGHVNDPGSDTCINCMLPLTHLDELALHDRVERSLAQESVQVLQPRPPVTVPISANLGLAMKRMADDGVGAVLVIDGSGDLVGILTERDFLNRVAGQLAFTSLPVKDFMTPSPESVSLADTLAFALGKMDSGGYRHLPVVSGGKPIGVISVRDILRHVTNICQTG